MNLYLVRHADAGDPAAWTGDDADRPLTPLGHQQSEALGEALRRQGVAADAIVTSPYVRAWETAAELRDVLLPGGKEPEHCEWLAAGVWRPRKVCKFLAGVGAKSVVAVGHAPTLCDFAAWLVGAGAGRIDLEKGGAALIEFEEGAGKGDGALRWVVGPGWYMPAKEEAPPPQE